MNICVYGASSALLKNIYYEKTEELGRAMGKRGHGIHVGALIIWGWQKLGVTCLDKHRRGLCCFSGFSGEGELFVGRRWGEELRYLAPL